MTAFGGLPVVVSPGLPIPPSFGESIRRRVRHGLADVLEWCGQDVGPKPDAVTHAVVSADPVVGGAAVVFVSRGMFERLRKYDANLVDGPSS